MLRSAPRQSPAVRRELFLSDEPPPVRSRRRWRLSTLAAAMGKLVAVAAVLACASVLTLRMWGGTSESVDPLSQARGGERLDGRGGADPQRTSVDAGRRSGDRSRKPDRPAPATESARPAAPAPAAPAPAAPAPAPSVDERAVRTLAQLADVRREARTRLARAKTARPQSAAARDLAAAYGQAASQLEHIDANRLGGLAEALRSSERAYAGLAEAITNVDQQLYDLQRQAVVEAEAAVARESALLDKR